MAVTLFNTLTRSRHTLVPLDPAGRQIRMYCCGPTVHDFAHIGNFRTFVFADLVRRWLQFQGHPVLHVMNITDVEDKIIRRVREQNTTLREYTTRYEGEFFRDFDSLGCLRPHQTPRATEFIPAMIELIERLLARGIAYQAPDRSIYFSIEKYQAAGHRYGQLLPLNLQALRTGDRVASDEYVKDALADFALWKARVPEDGDVFWPSPWGDGRPGWHIECSAMSMKLLGPSFDLHLGGEDLVFPHHEDEIAQSEGTGIYPPGARFVSCWLHGAHLLVEGKKMSKSLGNFFTLRDLLARGSTGREIRYLLLTAHYRESFNFTLDGLDGARSALARLDECLGRLRELAPTPPHPTPPSDPPHPLVERFTHALADDLNVSAAWAAVFEWVRDLNRQFTAHSITPTQAAHHLAAWQHLDTVLGLGQPNEDQAPPELLALLEQRQAARQSRDFARADALRDQLKRAGWIIEDTPKGPRLKRAERT